MDRQFEFSICYVHGGGSSDILAWRHGFGFLAHLSELWMEIGTRFMRLSNKPDAANAAIASRWQFGYIWRGVGDPE